VDESSESFRAADREQFYVSASRFKEALTIYTDDKRELLKAVCKSSQRPSATDLMKKEISESHDEISSQPKTVKKIQQQISETRKSDWLQRRNVRHSQSKGVRI